MNHGVLLHVGVCACICTHSPMRKAYGALVNLYSGIHASERYMSMGSILKGAKIK